VAIKGKSRKRSKARAPALPPRPTISARRTPLPVRRDVKRAAVIVLALVSLLGGLRLWQNISRSDALRTYDVALRRAQGPLLSHFEPNSLTNVQQVVQGFTQGQVTADQLKGAADLWEKDFKTTVDNIRKLKPPNDVARDAQEAMAQGIDGYVGVARMYNVAAQVKKLSETTRDATQKQALDGQVQVILQHATEWTERANKVYDLGNKPLTDLKVRYGIEEPLPPQQPQQQVPQ
jgi:hypothetical protein